MVKLHVPLNFLWVSFEDLAAMCSLMHACTRTPQPPHQTPSELFFLPLSLHGSKPSKAILVPVGMIISWLLCPVIFQHYLHIPSAYADLPSLSLPPFLHKTRLCPLWVYGVVPSPPCLPSGWVLPALCFISLSL